MIKSITALKSKVETIEETDVKSAVSAITLEVAEKQYKDATKHKKYRRPRNIK